MRLGVVVGTNSSGYSILLECKCEVTVHEQETDRTGFV